MPKMLLRKSHRELALNTKGDGIVVTSANADASAFQVSHPLRGILQTQELSKARGKTLLRGASSRHA